MIYSYNLIADYFIAFSNATHNLITNLKLQKLVYYAQAWHVAILGRRMFDAEFRAWVHGPVIYNLYNAYKSFSYHPIIRDDLTEEKYEEIRSSIQKETLEVLDIVVDKYFGMTAFELEQLSHSESPWVLARAGLSREAVCNEIIKDIWMKDYYEKYLE